MDLQEVLLAQHARTHSAAVSPIDVPLEEMLFAGLADDQARARPHPGLNSIAWLVWHMARSEDVAANLILAGRGQVLDGDGWARRIGVPRRDIGTGMATHEVDDLGATVDIGALRAYRAAVGRRTQEVIRGMAVADLAGEIDAARIAAAEAAGAFGANAGWMAEFWAGKPREFFLTFTIIGHSYTQLGEGWVIRGLLGLAGP